MIIQTLKLLGNEWCVSPSYISRFMKGLFNKIPPVPRYHSMWNVDHVIQFLRTLYPLENLSIKMLTFKTVTLVALAVAPRAQTLVSMNIDLMRVEEDKIIFVFENMLKTSKPGKAFQLELLHFEEEQLCVMHTLLFYLEKLKDKRKSRQLFVSFCSFNAVGTSTVARWLKTVLHLSGIDTSVFKAHSFRGASASAAFNKGCSVQQILKTGDWSSVRNFYKFYLRGNQSNDAINFAEAVLKQ